MKKSFLKLALVLLISALMISLVGCEILDQLTGTPDAGGDHTHQYTEEITKAPTCAEEGEKTFTCSCEDSYTEAIEKLAHTEETIPAVASTCTEAGLTEGKKCSVCNEILVAQESIDALEHSYDEGVVKTNPGCETKGVMLFTCECGHSYEEDIDPTNHDYTETVVPSTCVVKGYTEHVCSKCGDSYKDNEQALADHTYVGVETKKPGCETKGEMTYTCSVEGCGESYTEEIDEAGHDKVSHEAQDPTCTEDGWKAYETCNNCDYTTFESVSSLGHKGGTATCKDAKVCEVCGQSYGTPDKLNGHSYGEADCDSPATCKLCGDTSGDAIGHIDENKDHKCDRCQIEQGTHEDADKNHACDYGCSKPIGACEDTNSDHKCDYGCANEFGEHSDSDKNHSCDYGCQDAIGDHKDGDADQDHNCDYCGGYVDGEECIDENKNHKCDECFGTMGEHADSDGDGDHLCDYCNGAVEGAECNGGTATCTSKAVCAECGKEYGEKLAHTYNQSVANEETIKSAATCETSAVYYYSCSCGEINKADDADTFTYGEALGHKDENLDHVCDNGCGESQGEHADGEDNDHLCDYGCGATLSEHVYVSEVTTPATCTTEGLMTYKCACGDTYTEVIPAKNHDYDVTVVEATCTETGLKTFTCKNCSDKYTEVIPTSGHNFGDDFVCDNCNLDTTANRLENGGFENGLEGWVVVGNIGNVSADKNYWLNDPESAEGFEFGLDGDKMFSAYAPGAEESAVGTLTSSTFVVGGSGFVTFKLGAARDDNYVYIDVVDADTKQILARYYNGLWADRTEGQKSGCTLVAYKADLSAFAGREVFFRISDNADSGYGLFFADSFVTYYEAEPDGFNVATPVNYEISGTIYDLFNGSFEMGDVQGWWNNEQIGVVTNANGYWGDNIPYEKVGDFLFTGVESFGADTMREGNRGTLTSSVFEIGGTGWISFKLGGGGNELCYVQVIDAVTGEILARYHQQAQQDAKLIQYVADLSAYIGRTARIQVVDQAENGWGCVSFDHVVTYYPEGTALPEGITANNIYYVNYNITNGSFENGLEGWTQHIWEAGAHNTLGWVESSEHDAGWYTKNDDRKDGNNIFTFCRPDGTNCENTKGELVSSTFTLKQDSFVSFRFGGAGTRAVRIELVKADGTVIATFYNEAPGKVNTEMYAYFYQYTGETTECFFRVVDDSVSNYGCFVVDDFRVNLESAPEGFIAAIQ